MGVIFYHFEPLTKKTLISMTLKEASVYIESIKSETTKKSEIKIYVKFLYILAKLKTRAF